MSTRSGRTSIHLPHDPTGGAPDVDSSAGAPPPGSEAARQGLSRRQFLSVAAATVVPVSAAAVLWHGSAAGPAASCHVDLDVPVQRTDPSFVGVGLSTFGRLPTDPDQGLAERTLDARYVRVPVRWSGSSIVSSAHGADNRSVEAAIRTYYSWPGVRMILVVAGRADDWAGYRSGDAAEIVRRLRDLGMTALDRFDFSGPNEPDRLGVSMVESADRCREISDDLRAAGTSGRVWGPVWSNAAGDFRPFADRLGADRLAGIDWHFYPGGRGQDEFSVEQVLATVGGYGRVVEDVRTMLSDNGFTPNIAVGELNWSWLMGAAPAVFGAANTVMIALGMCTILRHGGRCLAYATQNGDLSLMADSYGNPDGRPPSGPMPAYWGVAALTGANAPGLPPLFPHFRGTFYATSSQDPEIRIFAVDNESGGYTIVVINPTDSSDKTVSIEITGAGDRTHDVLQTRRSHPYDAPTVLRRAEATGRSLALDCPAMTVTTVVLH